MKEGWLTTTEAAKLVGRSIHTIYTWINKTNNGTALVPLVIKRYEKDTRGKSVGWLIERVSLRLTDQSAPRNKRAQDTVINNDLLLLKSKGKKVKYDGNDTPERVRRDRKKWVKNWVEEGKPLIKILPVFDVGIHEEITDYYLYYSE
jgi:transposase